MQILRHIMPQEAKVPGTRSIEKGMIATFYDEMKEAANISHLPIKPRGYIFFQPGDSHDPAALKSYLSSLIIRIGDLHHLQNPLLRTIEFIESVSSITKGIYLNTNPSLLPFLKHLFPNCENMPISELTIEEGILFEARKLNASAFANRKRKRIAYIGSGNSPYHPRRSYWVNSLIKDYSETIDLEMLPSSNPKEWLNTCLLYGSVVSPSLNSQWSHNLFIPALVGTKIFTDCQSLPLYSYHNTALRRKVSPCSYASSLESLAKNILSYCGSSAQTYHEIAMNACAALEPASVTRSRVYENPEWNSNIIRNNLSQKNTDEFIRFVIAANIFEILQEIARTMVTYDMFTVSFKSSAFFAELSTYFHHPRLAYRKSGESSAGKDMAFIYVEGKSTKNMLPARLITINVDLSLLSYRSMRLSSRAFDPRKISTYELVQRMLRSTLGNDYRPVVFLQRLLDVVEVDY